MLLRNQKGAGVLETLLVCIVVSIMIGFVIPYHQKMAQEAKETALSTGLASIRKSIQLYALLHGKFPKDLKDLVQERYLLPIREDTFISGEYLRAQAVDNEGRLIDPFGSRFIYDQKGGTVQSGTKVYERW